MISPLLDQDQLWSCNVHTFNRLFYQAHAMFLESSSYVTDPINYAGIVVFSVYSKIDDMNSEKIVAIWLLPVFTEDGYISRVSTISSMGIRDSCTYHGIRKFQ